MKLSKDQIEQKIQALPENIQRAIRTFDWSQEVMAIGEKYHLQIDELELFKNETLEVIIGAASADTYEQKLERELNVDQATATKIVEEANQRIFSELQRRAFPSEQEVNENDSSLVYDEDDDPYLEPIEHHDVARHLKDEGIELLHEDDTHESENTDIAHSLTSEDPVEQPVIHDYREPIEETDLRGIKTKEVDTSIMRTRGQAVPDSVLGNDIVAPQQTETHRSIHLDKKLMETTHIPDPNTVVVPESTDTNFFEHMTNKKS
ncbi:hypothetical protein KC901_02780 [Patescibacteria group bacterium]|nr:hypothetical protein [Patescibacteria group bacterium]